MKKKYIAINVGDNTQGEITLNLFKSLIKEKDLKLFSFEPNSEKYTHLFFKSSSFRNNIISINKAVYDKDIFHKKIKGPPILKLKKEDVYIKDEVYVTRLDTFLKDNLFKKDETIIEFLNLNTFSVDLEAFSSLGDYLENVKEGCLTSLYSYEKSLFEDQESLYENTKDFLLKNNFEIIKEEFFENKRVKIFFKNKRLNNCDKKIALFFSGRFSEDISFYDPQIINFIKKNNVDTFISSFKNSTLTDDFKNQLNIKCYNYINKTNFIEKYKEIIEKGEKYKAFDYVKSFNVMSMFFHHYNNFLNIKKTNIKYDWVFYMRCDCSISKMFSLHSLKKDVLNIPIGNDYSWINDRCCLGEYSIMEKYCSLFDNLNLYLDKYKKFQPEKYLKHHLEELDILKNCNRITFDFYLNENRQDLDNYNKIKKEDFLYMKKEDIIIEVGAFDGRDTLNLSKRFQNKLKVFSFEAHPEIFQKTLKNVQSFSNIHLTNKAVCKDDKESINFYECKKGGASSILEMKDNEELIKHWGNNRKDIHFSGKVHNVECTRLDTFLNQQGFSPYTLNIKYIHIDAQGVDLDVLKSLGDEFLPCVEEGVVETSFSYEKAIYKDQKDVKEFLINNNFEITSITKNDQTNCEANVYFKRK